MRRFVLLLTLLPLLGCDRPFVPVAEPSIRPTDPALFTLAQTADSLDVRLRVTSFRMVETVEVGGVPLAREARSDVWMTRLPLRRGLNTLPVRATDAGGVTGVDTLFAFRLDVATAPGPGSLPVARTGHTATPLPDGRVLVAGGAAAPDGPAAADAFVISADGASVSRLETGLQKARAGHTATLLPDGRVLVAGGRDPEGSRDLSDFVGSVEVFDPQTGAFSPLPVQGSPIVRARHTAFLRRVGTRLVLELLGGEGNLSFASTPRFGIRDDLRPFDVTADALVALSPGATTGQGNPIAPLAGHLTVRLADGAPENGDYLIAGAYFGTGGSDATNLLLRVRERSLNLDPAPAPLRPRQHAAAVPLGNDGIVLVTGGVTGAERTVVAEAEVYVRAARRYFTLPNSSLPAPAAGHALVRLRDGRICQIGGTGADGAARADVPCFTVRF